MLISLTSLISSHIFIQTQGPYVFCAIDLSLYDAVSSLPQGTLGEMVCPRMCHGCNPAKGDNNYLTPWDYENVTICYEMNCTVLNMTATYDPARDGPVLSQIRSLRKLTLTHNSLISLNSTMQELVDLLDINLGHNNLLWFPTAELSSQVQLLELDLSHNLIQNLPTGMLTHLPKLRVLYLTHNMIEHVESYAFAHTASNIHGNVFTSTESLRLPQNAKSITPPKHRYAHNDQHRKSRSCGKKIHHT